MDQIAREELGSRLWIYPWAAGAAAARSFRVHREQHFFGADRSQCFQLFWPQRRRPHPVPVLLAHGGNRLGAGRFYPLAGYLLAAQGFITVLTGYRPAPAWRFPAQLDDVFAGLAAAEAALTASAAGLKALSCRFGMPRQHRWVLGGFSAGAQLAALMAFDNQAQQRYAFDPGRVAGFLSISGLLDLSLWGAPHPGGLLDQLLGRGGNVPAADPTSHVTGAETFPALLVHGLKDPFIPASNSSIFADAVNGGREHGPARFLPVPWMHHADFVRLFLQHGLPESWEMLDWLRNACSPGPGSDA